MSVPHAYLQVVSVFVMVTSCHMTEPCPQGCECLEDIDSHAKRMMCEGRDYLPLADRMYDLTMLNMSNNRVQVIHQKSFIRSPQLQMLDLSHNKINSVEDGALGLQLVPQLTSLNLSFNSLAAFPRNLSSSLQHLKITANNINKIEMGDLCYLDNLKSLYLDKNDVREFIFEHGDYDVLEHCSTRVHMLEVLSLGYNRIETIDKQLWKYINQVQYLSFANNLIKTVKADSFKGLKMLRYLDLSGNKIKTVAPKAVSHFPDLRYLSLAHNVMESFPESLPMVEWLDISYNQITEIPEGKKSSLYPQEVFLIGQNPLHCNCAMLWVKEFYDTREYQLKFIQIDSEKFIPVCSTPDHLHGDTWDVLANDAFGCNEPIQDQVYQDDDDGHKLVWKLRDLSIKIADVGDTYLKVEWDSVNIGLSTDEKHVIIFYIHPFGKKHQRKSVSVHPQVGRYVLKALLPETAYIVCMSVMTDKSGNPVNSLTSDDCLEIVTKETVTFNESWIMYFLKNPTFYLITLTLSICFVYTRSN